MHVPLRRHEILMPGEFLDRFGRSTAHRQVRETNDEAGDLDSVGLVCGNKRIRWPSDGLHDARPAVWAVAGFNR